MSTEPISLRVLADFASEAARFRLLEPTKVIAWADSMIEASEVPPTWLIDLSMVNASDLFAVRAALREVPGEPELIQSLALLNGLVLREWRAGRLTIGQVRNIGWRLFRDEYECRDSTEWGLIVECEAEALDEGFILEPAMREIIDGVLLEFDGACQRLPSWA